MKKLTALLLALIMVLSVFAACGEKTEAPADAQAQTGDTASAADEQTEPIPRKAGPSRCSGTTIPRR